MRRLPAKLSAQAVERMLATNPAGLLATARQMLVADPRMPGAHRLAARALRALGRADDAERAELNAVRASDAEPAMQAIAEAVKQGDLARADNLLAARLKLHPDDAAALRVLGALRMRAKRWDDAEALLRRALAIADGYLQARALLADLLFQTGRTSECLAELDVLEARDPRNAMNAKLRAAALGRIGDFDGAIAYYEALLARDPAQHKAWMSYGHMLKTVGRQQEALDAYRRAATLEPRFGEVWWSLANLKTVKFDDDDLTTMRHALTADGLGNLDRLHLHFALGKALEDRARWADSFRHYAAGNAIRKAMGKFDIAEVRAVVDRSIALFTPAFFKARKGWGCKARDPIFIVGMPRSGSTLVEQILASHPLVEGTQELPDLPAIGARISISVEHYPAVLAELGVDDVRALGEEYIERTRVQRRTTRPIFIDKLPNNWMHAGFIKLILPNARIIDTRRHPLSSCFSNFKQHFATGQNYTYDLADVGGYYAEYVRLMAHWDRIMPGAVHRVSYEDMVADSDDTIRALLAAMDLPFEPACLQFWETDRPVRTASSEQVRRPINRDGLEPWKPYGAWLGPLEQALGEVLTAYPDVPVSLRG